jgi:ribosomal protein S18 acetylase RimI-like enzyme
MTNTRAGVPARPERSIWATEQLCMVPAQLSDCDAVLALFEALHRFNATLDSYFALADEWEALFRREFRETVQRPDHLYLLVKAGNRAVGLLIAAIHSDSPLFHHRRWIEVEALYVAPSHRSMGIGKHLLNQAYQWAKAQQLSRVQLYVTASNVRAQTVYTDQGFMVTQVIMRKSL